jgi:hypothetical protein
VVLIDPPPSSSWNRQTVHPVLSWLGTAAACASRSRCNERPGQVSRAVSRHWWIIARNIRDSSSACRLLIPWRLAFIALTALPPTVSDRLTAHPRVPVANERRLPLPSFRCPAVAHDSGPIVRLTDSSEVPACEGDSADGTPLFTCCGPLALLACFTKATGRGFLISNSVSAASVSTKCSCGSHCRVAVEGGGHRLAIDHTGASRRVTSRASYAEELSLCSVPSLDSHSVIHLVCYRRYNRQTRRAKLSAGGGIHLESSACHEYHRSPQDRLAGPRARGSSQPWRVWRAPSCRAMCGRGRR